MRCLFISVLMMILVIMSATPGTAAEGMKVTVTFDPAELSWEILNGYDLPRLSDCDLTREVGAPQLPARSVQVVIPAGLAVDGIEVIDTSSSLLPQRRRIYPAQPPQILSLGGGKSQAISFVQPHPAMYMGEGPYPGRVAEYTGCGRMGQVQLASLVFYPLQYLPAEEKILFHDRVDVVLHLSQRVQAPLSPRFSEIGRQDSRIRAIGRLAHNGEDIDRLYPHLLAGRGAVLGQDLAEYVIVTDLAFESAFQTLADWKTKKGVPARVVTVQWIEAQYQGADRQEKIRRFILDAYGNWGAVWVLLAGDTQLIPVRYAYAMDSETQYNDIPCDLYYADLDGDWNADGDGTFGEVEDEVDLFPEVFIGRAPVSTLVQAENFVRKVLVYEKPTLLDYQQKALFAADILWYNPYTDASESKELIDERYLPPQFDPVTKLYMSQGNETPFAFLAAVDQGVGIINHDGHAYYSVMGMGTGYIGNSDMDYLHNGDRLGILYSIGCWPAAFDYDCIAEHFLNNLNGGGVAFVGNSRYGWGSPGNPCFGYSDRFDQQFFKTVFQDGITRIGEALTTSKALYAPRSYQENVYRWHQYQLTLLGDPEMPLWTQTPRSLTVEHPQQIPADSSLVTVLASHQGQPIDGALVCLMGADDVYQRAITDHFGRASFNLCMDSSQTIAVTVTAADFVPYEGQMLILSSGPYLAVQEVDVQELAGNNDGAVSPGEHIGLALSIKNWGDQTASGVTATISWHDGYLAVEDSAFSFGDIEPNQVVFGDSLCCFSVGTDCPDGHPLRFFLQLKDQDGHSWMDEIGIRVATPVLLPYSYLLHDDVLGDGDGVPEAGEGLDVTIEVVNSGGERARELIVELETEDPYLTVIQPQAELGDVEAGATAQAAFQLQVDAGCPMPQFPILQLSGNTSDGYEFQRDLLLTVGQVGFFDDLEASSHFWSARLSSPYWQFSHRRSHSGALSWYCGRKDTACYQPNMDCSLTTMSVVVGPGAKLSFWHWYDLATYGSDGLYVEMNTGSGWEVLDFLGSGGALDSALIGNDWFQDSYDLSHIEPGTFLQVRFRFCSDADSVVGEGVYIDDVSITSDILSAGSSESAPSVDMRPASFRLSQNYPNPFNAFTNLMLVIPDGAGHQHGSRPVPVSVEIYNISGQRVKVLLKDKLGVGEYRLVWDGADEQGRQVSSGIYLCHVQAGLFRQTRKMFLLR